MPRKKLTTKQREERRINSNKRQAIARARRNKKPFRIGTKPSGKPLLVKGKQAVKERIRVINAGAEYERSIKVTGTRVASESTSKLNPRDITKMNFKDRASYNNYMKFKSPQAQNRMLNDKGNSLRQSFRTRAENIGISEKLMNTFEERFKELSDQELLAVVNKNMKENNLTFEDIFDSDQEVDDLMIYKQVQNMYRALGLDEEMQYMSNEDVGTEFISNDNWVHYDYDQEERRINRRAKGMP